MSSRRSRIRAAVAALSTVLVLGPTAVLFGRIWQDNAARRTSTTLERDGVAYLAALTPLLTALAASETAAVQGGPAPASLAAAVDRVSEVDGRLGAELRTRPRWSGLRDEIGKLSGSGGASGAYLSHAEVTDLTVALYDAVRRTSGLDRDPDVDLSNLQTAVADDLPTVFVQVSRLGDLARSVAKATDGDTGPLSQQLAQAAGAVPDAVDRLTDDLQAAADDTASETLSGNLVGTLDPFRRGVEALTRAAKPGAAPDLTAVAAAQSSLQTALTNLAGLLLQEMSTLLDARMTALDARRTEALALAGGSVLLVLLAVALTVTGRRRDAPAPAVRPGTPPSGDASPTRRERAGALR